MWIADGLRVQLCSGITSWTNFAYRLSVLLAWRVVLNPYLDFEAGCPWTGAPIKYIFYVFMGHHRTLWFEGSGHTR